MLLFIALTPLVLGASAVMTAVYWGTRTPKQAPLAAESYDDVDYAWLQNAIIMPEIAPVPRRPVILNQGL